MNEDMREVINEFLVESNEGLDRLDSDLVELETDPTSRDALASIFRTMHTIKGTCGFLGFGRLEGIAHAAENLLSLLRDGKLTVDRPIVNALLASVDAVRAMLVGVETTGEEPLEEYAELKDLLHDLQQPRVDAAPLSTVVVASPAATKIADVTVPVTTSVSQNTDSELTRQGASMPVASMPVASTPEELFTVDEVAQTPTAEVPMGAVDEPVSAESILEAYAEDDQAHENEMLTSAGQILGADTPVVTSKKPEKQDSKDSKAPKGQAHPDDQPIPGKKKSRNRRPIGEILKEKGFVNDAGLLLGVTEQNFGDTRRLGQILESLGIVTEEQLMIALREQQVLDEDRQTSSEATVRVDVHLLDSLMNLIGELVLARNQLVQLATDRHDAEYLVPAQRLNIITSELQAGVMKTRMQPIGSVWQRLPRVVRDLTVALGKQVRIEVDGAETELDRTILEAIKDPLTHIVRNAVDHGIETPAVRTEAGKTAEGTLHLRAYHESGKMNIEITDDGAGIDPAKIRAKAISTGVLTADQASRVSDREVLACIFAPGFSTAEQVTNISGRGVGMDVVKTNIEKIGGAVEIQSEVGRGTTIRIKIPLTLAIIPALVVLSSGQRYVIPQINLVELVRLDTGEMSRRIEMIHGAPVYRLRGRLLPIVDLSDMLAGGSGIDMERSLASSAARSVNVVVLQSDGQAFGLIVDGVFDTQEIVVKPLGKQLRDIRVFAGATIMGDGKLALILDVVGLARQAGVMKEQVDRPITSRGTSQNSTVGANSSTLVVVQVGTEQTAIPLAKVARLERFSSSSIERSQGRSVVQYRNEILPLIDLASAIGQYGNTPGESVSVLVHSIGSRMVGVVVDSIIDITEADLDRRDAEGIVMGTAVIDNRVTSVIDTASLIESMYSNDLLEIQLDESLPLAV